MDYFAGLDVSVKDTSVCIVDGTEKIAREVKVDIVTTMSDASAPLTTLEYDEWGNPAIEPEYNYMLSYSPYDNVAQTSYPPMFVTAGFYDSQVNYAEPAKWVAKLRANKTDTHDLVFKTDMTTGHNGRSGRLGSIKESAEIMGWLIAHAREGRLPDMASAIRWPVIE
jgi:oligopeptidase B